MKKIIYLFAIIGLLGLIFGCAKTKPLTTSSLPLRNIDTIVKLKPRHVIKLAKIDAKVRIIEAKEETKREKEETKQDKVDVKREKVKAKHDLKKDEIAVKQSKADLKQLKAKNKHDVAIKKQDTKQDRQATKIATADKFPRIFMWISIMIACIVIGLIIVFLLVRRK